MLTLFIDTHDKDIVLALYDEEKVIDKRMKTSERNHTSFVMPMLKELLESNAKNVHDLEEILVVNGPGSFTGIRIGVTIAKTLAYTLNIPIKTITSLEVYAVSKKCETNKLPIIRDIKGVYGCLYSCDNKALGDIFYKSNQEFTEYINANNYEDYIIESDDIDLDAVFIYSKSLTSVHAHQANPLYIKVIEALKDDKKA